MGYVVGVGENGKDNGNYYNGLYRVYACRIWFSFCPRGLGFRVLFPFHFGVSGFKLNTRKKGTLILTGLLGNLAIVRLSHQEPASSVFKILMVMLC